MKIGLIVSGVIVVVAVGLFLIVTLATGTATPPTSQTSPERLKRAELPATLRPVHAPANAEEDATPAYDELLRVVGESQGQLTASPPAPEAVAPVTALLLRAADAGKVQRGFLDKSIPVAVTIEPAFGEALEVSWAAALDEADRLHRAGDVEAALRLARAVFVLGERAFRENTLLYNRLQGLAIVASAGSRLYEWAPEAERDNLAAWGQAVTSIESAWREKLGIVSAVKPHPGDLLNVAQRDEDPTFRIAGVLRLGIARHSAGSRANRVAMESAIAAAQASGDPLLKQAGDAADAVTADDVKRIR